MAEFRVREAGPDDARSMVTMIRCMVVDMASHGGHAPARDPASWDEMVAAIAEDLGSPRAKFVIAQSATGDWLGVAGGELVTLGGAFAPKETLHISVVFVVPSFRRAGIARALIETLLHWGRATGATECDLNVLGKNPARGLYEKLGFAPFEVKMVLPLRPAPGGHQTT